MVIEFFCCCFSFFFFKKMYYCSWPEKFWLPMLLCKRTFLFSPFLGACLTWTSWLIVSHIFLHLNVHKFLPATGLDFIPVFHFTMGFNRTQNVRSGGVENPVIVWLTTAIKVKSFHLFFFFSNKPPKEPPSVTSFGPGTAPCLSQQLPTVCSARAWGDRFCLWACV